MSDYGHHPTEISLTLKAIKDNNIDKKILTIFQPHQYSRTFELIEDFKNCFKNTDKLIIPNIYESRDSKEDKEKINTEKFVNLINHDDIIN
jgi:UDP-N-acetylmuramate--alanine ligase